MRLLLLFIPLLAFLSCGPKGPEHRYTVQNLLLPLEPPLTERTVQSRAIRLLGRPFDGSIDLKSIYLYRAEIGNPDFPNLNFAKKIRLSLVDPDGKIIPIADSAPIPRDLATITLIPAGRPDILRMFQQQKLDLLLEVDNTLVSDQGVMLIGNFEFAYTY